MIRGLFRARAGRVTRHRGVRRTKWSLERLEDRLALSNGFTLTSATETDGHTVSVTYDVAPAAAGGSLGLNIYRSANSAFDASDVRVAGVTFSGSDTATGTHTVTVSVPAGLVIDPSHPYVLAVANPVGGTAGAGDVASFRKYTVGVVTHGLDATPPAWVQFAAAGLQADGFDKVIPYYWTFLSTYPAPGLAVYAGKALTLQVIQTINTLPANSVVDVQMIGHSRGSVVITEAMKDLLFLANAGYDPGHLKGVVAGWSKLTYLDPHPAHNVHTTTTPNARFFSASPGPVGRFVTFNYLIAQNIYQDPDNVVPAGVDAAEVFYQHAPYYAAPDPAEKIFNVWGEPNIPGATASYDLTGIANGHFNVPLWYVVHVLPTLRTGGTFTLPAPTLLPTQPTVSPVAYERSVLYPGLVNDPTFANVLIALTQMADTSYQQGNLPLGLTQSLLIGRFLSQQSRYLTPAGQSLFGYAQFFTGA